MATGVALGLGIATLISRVIQTMLFELDANDVPTMAMATVVLVVSASAAALIPSARASRVDPAAALRGE